jgi:hypothetical protein
LQYFHQFVRRHPCQPSSSDASRSDCDRMTHEVSSRYSSTNCGSAGSPEVAGLINGELPDPVDIHGNLPLADRLPIYRSIAVSWSASSWTWFNGSAMGGRKTARCFVVQPHPAAHGSIRGRDKHNGFPADASIPFPGPSVVHKSRCHLTACVLIQESMSCITASNSRSTFSLSTLMIGMRQSIRI